MDTLTAAVDKKFASVAHFAGERHGKCPVRLRAPHNTREFKALTPAGREAAIRANLLAEAEREQAATATRAAKAKAARAEAPPAAEPVPAPEPYKPRADRHVVACAGGCDRMIPTRPGGSTLATCSRSAEEQKHDADRLASTARRLGLDASALTPRTPKPRPAADELAPGRKRPKVRRRYQCGASS